MKGTHPVGLLISSYSFLCDSVTALHSSSSLKVTRWGCPSQLTVCFCLFWSHCRKYIVYPLVSTVNSMGKSSPYVFSMGKSTNFLPMAMFKFANFSYVLTRGLDPAKIHEDSVLYNRPLVPREKSSPKRPFVKPQNSRRLSHLQCSKFKWI